MTKIDTTKPIMVTGANGYVASWLVKRLLEEGHTVHATVRNPGNKEKIKHLENLSNSTDGTIKFFQADLLQEGSFAKAMEGCELVYHTASPFTINVKNPQKELIAPAEQGTANVLNTATGTPSVKRVVVTSSCAAMYTDAIDTHNTPKGMLTEDDWNKTASLGYQPYSYSKTLAEKKAWEIADSQNQWNLVTINPSFVMGPFLNAGNTTSESINILKNMGDGTMKNGVPKFGCGVVDVRDVAEAHFKAGMDPDAKGRYITSAHNTNFYDMAQTLVPKFGTTYPLPKKAAPKWLLMLLGPVMDKNLNRKMIKNNVDVEWKADNSKITSQLGLQFRPLKQTMEDAFQNLIANNII